MDGTLEAIREIMERGAGPAAFAVLFGSALVEYLFPPFPGDAVTLLGAFAVARWGWNGAAVFVSVLAGSVAGAMLDFAIGRWLGKRAGFWERRGNATRARVERIISSFRRHGAAYIVVNRFLPGVRALIFVAAGMAGLRGGAVLLWASLSAALWNAAIFAAGYTVGTTWERLLGALRAFATAAWIAVAVVAASLLALALLRRRGAR